MPHHLLVIRHNPFDTLDMFEGVFQSHMVTLHYVNSHQLHAPPHPIQQLEGHKTRVFSWHQDTCDVPNGATLLASTPLCENQAFQYENAIGLQFHIEVPHNPVKEWLCHRQEEFDQYIINQHQFRLECAAYIAAYHKAVGEFLEAWFRLT